jgi:nitrous oxidase accessory protein
VRVDGGGDALGNEWASNDFDDYAGYDLDHDGVGDVPYELRDLADGLVARSTDLTFFTGTPALALVSLAGHVVPLMAPKPRARRRAPALSPRLACT